MLTRRDDSDDIRARPPGPRARAARAEGPCRGAGDRSRQSDGGNDGRRRLGVAIAASVNGPDSPVDHRGLINYIIISYTYYI